MSAPVSQNITFHEGISQARREELSGQKGATLWFTGLSVAKLIASSCTLTLTAFISPYLADRALARKIHDETNIPFLEIFVDAPLETVEKRDPKGLYAKARAGVIKVHWRPLAAGATGCKA
ncbi:hypothetical protein JCM8097_007355 [Rhodosporidiobolus ruineniae]